MASPAPDPPLSQSPAAMFLSAFMSPVQPAPKEDDQGQVIAGYTLGPIIGYGASSVIRRATSSSGSVSAVKIIRRFDLLKAGHLQKARKRLQHEAAVWATLTHEHILPLFTVTHTPYADYFFTLLCPAGSLFDILKRDGTPALLQDDAGMMFRQVVRGLHYLHQVASYVHRDMKLENVLVDEMGVCKIGDFGMTRRIGATADSDEEDCDDPVESADEAGHGFPPGVNSSVHRAVSLTGHPPKRPARIHTLSIPHSLGRFNTVRHRNSTAADQPQPHLSFQPGSLPYAAPELLLPHTSDSLRPHPRQDIWALGVILYALLTGGLPFADSFEPRLQMKILNGSYEIPQGIGKGAERILQGCLDRNISTRWTISMVDEVAWGVGWGAEGDDATPSEEEQAPVVKSQPKRRSQSRPRPTDIVIQSADDWQNDESRSRPSIDTASRRSTSRQQRSLSRAPALTDPSTSVRSANRSMSRHQGRDRSPQSSIYDSLASPTIISRTSSGMSDPTWAASPATASPSFSMERGRGRRRLQPGQPLWFGGSRSRSPSPSMVPRTPQDGPLLIPSTSAAEALLEHPDELSLDMGIVDDVIVSSDLQPGASRGRTTTRISVGHGSEKAVDDQGSEDVGHGRVLSCESDILEEEEVSLDLTGARSLPLAIVDSQRRTPRPASSPPLVPRKHVMIPIPVSVSVQSDSQEVSSEHHKPSLESFFSPSLTQAGGIRSRSAEHFC